MEQLHCVIHGKVQGVWFRAWTRDMAAELGVAGWVRNLPGGQVEAMAQGEPGDLDLFLERVHEGPPLARVTSVETSRTQATEVLDDFSVRYG